MTKATELKNLIFAERIIVKALVKELFKNGYQIQVQEEGEPVTEWTEEPAKVFKEVGACCDTLLACQKDGAEGSFVHLIHNNGNDGLDVISNYSVSLEPVMKPVFNLIERMEAR